MTLRPLIPLGIVLLCGFVLPPSGAAAPPSSEPRYIGSVPDTGQFLPDTTVLASVDDEKIRARDFVDAYYASWAEVRPAPDIAGRTEFLRSMINRHVLGKTALAINRPFGFEDRVLLRGHTQRVLSNVLYRRAVYDSVKVTEDDVQAVYQQFKYEQHFRHLLLGDLETAEKVRAALVSGKLKWSDAVRRYNPSSTRDGDMGWVPREKLDRQWALRVYGIKPGEISEVVQGNDGFHIVTSVERRPIDPPGIEPLRRMLRIDIHARRSSELADRLQAQIAARIGMVYDSTNIRFAATQFQGFQVITQGPEGPVLDLSGSVPEFSPPDTARVLARHRDGRFSLGDFLHAYNDIAVPARQPVADFESFRTQLDGMVLEPYLAEMAVARGLEKDSITVALVAKKREEILVDHLYSDSIASRVYVGPKERQKYYQDHIAQYMTYPSVRFASIVRPTRGAADSLLARLKAGERAADILRADSLRGQISGSIQGRSDNEKGDYHKLLFGELRPGQGTVVGPDKEGTWMVLQLLEFDAGRQLSYAEAEHYVNESLQNIRAEELLKALIARHEKRFRITSRPELLMRVRLIDPAALD